MNILLLLAPFSVFLGLVAVGAFVWTLRSGQYDDIRGAAERILIDEADPITTDPGRDAGDHERPPHGDSRLGQGQTGE